MSSRSLAALLAAAALVALAGCGDDADDTPPQQLLSEAATKPIQSADVELAAKADVPGFPILGSDLSVSASGPIEASGADSLPELDWKVTLRGGGQTFPARMTVVDDRAFVEFQLRPYEVDPELLGVVDLDGGGGALTLKRLGLDPSGWLRNAQVSEGEEIDGDSTRLVTGQVDTPAVLSDLLALAESSDADEGAGLPQLEEDDIDSVADAVDRLRVEVNVDDEGYPRRVHADLRFTVPDTVKNTAIEDGTVSFDLELDDIDEAEVDVRPPVRPDDFADLLDFAGLIFGIEEPSDLWEQP